MKTNIAYIFIYFLICFLSFTPESYAKTVPFVFELPNKYEDATLSDVSVEKLELYRKYTDFVFSNIGDELIINNFPVSYDELGKVILKPLQSPVGSNTVFETVDDNGRHIFVPDEVKVFSGHIAAEPQSEVFLTYSVAGIYAVIRHATGEIYSISPQYNSSLIIQKHYLTRGDKLKTDEVPWICYTEDNSSGSTFSKDMKHLDDIPLSPSKLLDVEIACEATAEFYQLFNDIERATAYITSVIAYSSKIYEENINVRLTISYVLIWQNPSLDPYRDLLYLNEKLGLMPDLWEPSNVERSITVLFASLAAQPGGTMVAGIAYGGTPGKGNLCNKKWGYCVLGIRGGVNFPTTNYSWDVNVAAHEIGHLFGAPHTHVCYWDPPIDTCVTKDMGIRDACNNTGFIPRPGTIMSYCHLTNSTRSVQLFFHPLQKPLMRRAAEKAECNEYVSVPYISLLNPLGGKTYRAGEVIPVRWTAANINTVSIKYSLDSGKHWIPIADFLNADDSIYNWKTPLITNNRVLVVVHKATDMAINDRSWLTFGIAEPNITLIVPSDGDEFARNTNLEITWESVFVDSLNIYFTSDGGKTWQFITTVNNAQKYKWRLPDIESNECQFKLSSIDGTDVIVYSGHFSIGTPFADIISPEDNDVLCLGEYYTIRWDAAFLKYIYLYYSLNGGSKWTKITLVPIVADKKEYNWKVKKGPSDEAKIRIASKINDSLVVLDETAGHLIIRDCTSDVSASTDSRKHRILLFPDPAGQYLNITINPKANLRKVNVKVYSLKGRLFTNYDNMQSERLQIDLSKFPQGTYIIILSVNDTIYMKKFNVAR